MVSLCNNVIAFLLGRGIIMVTKKLYLYRLLGNHYNSPPFDLGIDGVIISNKWPLMGLDRHIWRGGKIRDFEKSFHLKPFEVEQDNFDLFIRLAKNIGIKILHVEFSDELSEEEDQQLRSMIKTNNTDQLLDFIEFQREEMARDVEGITFLINSLKTFSPIKFTRNAVLTVEQNDEVTPHSIMGAIPVGLLAGIVSEHTVLGEDGGVH
jgi:hypothetical protein